MIRKTTKASSGPTNASNAFQPILIGAAVIVVLFAVLAGRGFLKPSREATELKDTASLVERVGKHILIKTDEQPTIATVQDPESLRSSNPFFYQYAEAGDRLLVWSDKAVLYSVKQDKILAVLPIQILAALTGGSIQPPPAQPQPSEQATSTSEAVPEDVTIEIRNGTLTPGLGRNLADKLKAAGLKTVLTPRDASKKGYEKTIVSRISDKQMSATLQGILAITKSEVAEAPADESGVKGDILIVIGDDYQP